MHVNEGSEAEYERRHSPIWAELEATLREHGAHKYVLLHAVRFAGSGRSTVSAGLPRVPKSTVGSTPRPHLPSPCAHGDR